MIRGLGIDLCGIARIEKVITERPRFLERVYTPAERARIAERGAQTAAGYFAAKEAVAKALGTGFVGFGFGDISIEPDEQGKPVATLTGGALARLLAVGGASVYVSITHEGGTAAAVAIIEAE